MPNTVPARGKFITFEGVDGAGKSTHIPFVADCLRRHGREVVVTREPGGTPLGEKLRQLLLSEPMHLETEALLMFAARREHLAQVILPTLERGHSIVCDRFTDATRAYQGGGRELRGARIEALAAWVHPQFEPDVIFLFDVPLETAQARLNSGRESKDRFETEAAQFHARVRAAYLDQAAREPQRFCIIDGTQSIEAIHKTLEQLVLTRCL